MLAFDVYYQMGKGGKTLTLDKGRERYTFRYNPGDEDDLLDLLIETAKSKNFPNFDWFDAAVLSFKITQSLIKQADELISESTRPSFDPRDYYQ